MEPVCDGEVDFPKTTMKTTTQTHMASTDQGAFCGFLLTNNAGSIGTASRIAVAHNVDTNSLLITGDSVNGRTLIGFYNFTTGSTNGVYSFISTVPEPSTYGLLGFGLPALLGPSLRCRFE
jgi:hypothetical protein